MSHRGQWSEHEARGVLSAWSRSGQSIESFARERGLIPQRIRWWKAKLAGQHPALPPSESSAVTLVPVELTGSTTVPTPEPAPTTKRGEPVAVYLRSGHIVKVGRGFDEDAFSRVVALLGT